MSDGWAMPAMWDWAINEVQQQPTIGGGVVVGALLAVLRFAYRLLAEAQRRSTLEQILTRAPGGSVIKQKKGLIGPAMSIWVGAGPPATAYRGQCDIVILVTPAPARPGLPGGPSSRDT